MVGRGKVAPGKRVFPSRVETSAGVIGAGSLSWAGSYQVYSPEVIRRRFGHIFIQAGAWEGGLRRHW